MKPLTMPAPLQPGDLLKVVSPSGRLLEPKALMAGVELWRSQGYRVEFTSGWDAKYGYLAGDDASRRKALAEAWFDPECKGILCTRGGYGGMRLLENWDWKIDQVTPKWLIGFSDITSLLWSLGTVGIGSIHGPVLITLPQESPASLAHLFKLVRGEAVVPLQGKSWVSGKAEGILLPANLNVATHLLNTPLQPNLKDVILALEDVTEAPYSIDRMLTHWRLCGALEKVKGIALGRFSQCDELGADDSFSTLRVLGDRLKDLGIPIVAELPFGHGGVNFSLISGASTTIDADKGILDIHFP